MVNTFFLNNTHFDFQKQPKKNKISLKGASSVNFSVAPQTTLEQMMSGELGSSIYSSYYDEGALTLSSLK
jgi:hypothetical protein